MAKYQKSFLKTVWGFVEVQAYDNESAQEQLDNGQGEEFDNKSEYEYENWEKVD